MSSPKGRVLYTEDDPDSRALVIFMLTRSGYEVSCAETGSEALTLAKNEHFDLFLIDHWLPGLTGPELTRHIRAFNKTTPILFYSAAAYETDRQAALHAGAQAYLTKPYGGDQLVAEIDRLIASS